MARPETIADITGSTVNPFGSVNIEYFSDQPELLAAFATFQKAVVKGGGSVKRDYGSRVEFALPKTQAELETQLRYDQNDWDRKKEIYETCAATGSAPESYMTNTIAEWSKGEGLPSWEEAFTTLMDGELAESAGR